VHRIGRTGRAGRAGLAVTIAERRDAGMIHRIQRFTTQRIPAGVIEGLEPKRPEPQSQTKPQGQKPGKGMGHKPGRSFGPKAGKPFGPKPAGKPRFANKSGAARRP
jgi:superfamily II DNA/RNA helicase